MMEIQLHDALVCGIHDQEMSVLEDKYKGQDERVNDFLREHP
jgi:hypothetical protein